MRVHILRARWLDWRWLAVLEDGGRAIDASPPYRSATHAVQWAARAPVGATLQADAADRAELLAAVRDLRRWSAAAEWLATHPDEHEPAR